MGGGELSKEFEEIGSTVSNLYLQASSFNDIVKAIKLLGERTSLVDLQQSHGCDYAGCGYRVPDRKYWMAGLDPRKLMMNKIEWPGTHNSATKEIGIPLITRLFAECQTLSIYEQLANGDRLLDIRVQEDRCFCHGPINSYSVDIFLEDVKFLAETASEIIILEIRTEFGHTDPPEFDKYIKEKLGSYLIRQDDHVFCKTVTELLPKRVICIWKPRNSAGPQTGSLLWSGRYLKDDWIDTDLPLTKFESNWKHLGEQTPVPYRKFFYRVENTLTPTMDNPRLYLTALTGWIN